MDSSVPFCWHNPPVAIAGSGTLGCYQAVSMTAFALLGRCVAPIQALYLRQIKASLTDTHSMFAPAAGGRGRSQLRRP